MLVANKNKMSAVVVYFIYIFIYLFIFFFCGGGGGGVGWKPNKKDEKETEVSQVIDNFYMLLAKFLWVLNSQNLNVFKLGICFLN